jgi:hypothetical protein
MKFFPRQKKSENIPKYLFKCKNRNPEKRKETQGDGRRKIDFKVQSPFNSLYIITSPRGRLYCDFILFIKPKQNLEIILKNE